MQETIPLGFHQCQLIAEKDEQIPDLTLLLAPLGQTVQHPGIPFLLKMQHEVLLLFFSPHFIGDTLNTKAECVKDSLICRKYLFLAKTFAMRSTGIQLVPSPHWSVFQGSK